MRNRDFKLIRFERAECDVDQGAYEFYDLRLGLDIAPLNLLEDGEVPDTWSCSSDQPFQCEALTNYNLLLAELGGIFASEVFVEGDGNLDKKVDGQDVAGVQQFQGKPSWFDFNNDGTTDRLDLRIVLQNMWRR